MSDRLQVLPKLHRIKFKLKATLHYSTMFLSETMSIVPILRVFYLTKQRIILCIFIATSALLILSYTFPQTFDLSRKLLENVSKVWFDGSQEVNSSIAKSQPQDTCVMPVTPVLPSYFRGKWKPTSLGKFCTYEKKLAVLKNESVLVSIPQRNATCWMEVTRGKKDSEYNVSKCKPLKSAHHFKEEEAILVRSGHHFNAFINFPTSKVTVRSKLRHWETKKVDEMPISVFILGVDTSSRSQIYRSLPKTLEVFKRLNFIDFKAFHSVAPSTLSTMMAFLMGLRRDIVRQTCAPDWSSPFDACPFIWNKYSDRHYITFYMEDERNTFSWGGQSGFQKQPTDYYLSHLFLALKKFRKEHIKKLGIKNGKHATACASNDTLAHFMLKTSQSFSQKFAHVPFFEFVWLNNPFHEDLFALQGYDNTLRELFESFESRPELLRRTLIIFLSDHGDRFSFYNSRSLESFIERGHPPLFIRAPEKLIERHPDIVDNLKANAQKFVTPFDIHQTLLHVLVPDTEFDKPLPRPPSPHPPDERASLFTNIPRNRTCAGNNIHAMNCLCNILYNQDEAHAKTILDSNKSLRLKVLRFAEKQLNLKVSQSNYSQVCNKWTTKENGIKYIRKIGQTHKQVLDFIMAFTADPGKAAFEMRLKLYLDYVKKGETMDGLIEFLGITRTSRYGDHSWCVRSATDADKVMKGFCYCKKKKPNS